MKADIYQLPANEYCKDDELILIPEGTYRLSYQYHRTWFYQGKFQKLIVMFRVMDFGDYFEAPLAAYYNVSIKGKPKHNGTFKAGWRSRFMFDYATCFGKPVRKDRIPMTDFKKNLVLGKVRTVEKNYQQRDYPDTLKYSVVDSLLGVCEL